jgi:hypothetical protein
MSPEKRRMARQSMQQADFIIDLLMRANADFRHLFGLVRQGISALSHRGKTSAATPQWRLP